MSEFPVYDFDPFNLPPEYLRAVGLVAMASAQTESTVSDLIGGLLGADLAETPALTTHMAMPLKDHAVRALAELNAPTAEIVDEIDELMNAINGAMTRRNAIIHNALVVHPDTGEVLSHRLKARGSLQLVLVPISAKEIEEDARLINKAGLDLVDLLARYNLWPKSRAAPLREPLDRTKAARAKRREVAPDKCT